MEHRSTFGQLPGADGPCIDHESTKNTKTHEEEGVCMLRVTTPLSDEVERLVHDTIGCCIAVHRALGPGLLETIYSRAIALELAAAGIAFEREKSYAVTYRGELLHEQRLDFVVGGAIVLEIKAVEHLVPIHDVQLVNYMRIARVRAGLLMNFNVVVLKDGLKRKIL
jgi:GxxExxY protein